MFGKILIANRGEIVVRRIRTCRKLGIKTVAVYSELDTESQHVAYSDEAESEARRVGFPVLIKASFGGGGRGMRIVKTASELRRSFDLDASEAKGAFGRSELYLEKHLNNPRHIEVQLIAGQRGQVVHL